MTPSICSCIHDTVCSALLEMGSVTPSGPLAPDGDDRVPVVLLLELLELLELLVVPLALLVVPLALLVVPLALFVA